jgi:protein NrfD
VNRIGRNGAGTLSARRNGGLAPSYDGESYYGRPAVKPSHWDWTVSSYIYLAGIAGAAQGIAAIGQVADRQRYRAAIGNARFLATASCGIGAGLLILDLKTPQRWYNMMRILRTTSPMSFGSYFLAALGGLSGLTVLGELARGRERDGIGGLAEKVADIAQIGAAVAGAAASTYTASLLACTSSPYWSAAPSQLGMQFAGASVATAAAALSIGEQLSGRVENSRRLDDVAALATVVNVVGYLAAKAQRKALGVSEESYGSPQSRALQTGGLLLAGALPLGAYLVNRISERRSPGLSLLASAGILAGGFMLRHATLRLGLESTRKPGPYFRLAQPENLPPALEPKRLSGSGRRRLP